MRVLTLFLFLVLSTCSRKAYQARLNQPVPDTTLSAEAVRADLDYLHAAVERISPRPYLNADPAVVAAEYELMKTRGAQSPVRFYESLRRVLATYNASHYSVSMPADIYRQELKDKDLGVFPFQGSLQDDQYVIDRHFRPEDSLLMGATLHRINGMDADSLFLDYQRYEGGLETAKRYYIRQIFYLLLYSNGIHSPFQFDVTLVDGNRTIIEHDGYRYPSSRNINEKPKQTAEERLAQEVSFRMIDRTGYLRVSSFSGYDYAAYQELLVRAFTTLATEGGERLVVDARGNGGGNDLLARWLLTYTTDKPYRFYGGQHFKVSKEANRNFRYSPYLPWLFRQIPYGLYIRLSMKKHPAERNLYVRDTKNKPEAPKENPFRFSGPVYYVIDNGTYSSGVTLVNAVEDYDLGTLIGQPTGGAPTEPGEVIYLRLPNSGLRVGLPSKYFIRANGDADNLEPVRPDVLIERGRLQAMTAEELAAFVDNLD